jgi:hypothetical protein
VGGKGAGQYRSDPNRLRLGSQPSPWPRNRSALVAAGATDSSWWCGRGEMLITPRLLVCCCYDPCCGPPPPNNSWPLSPILLTSPLWPSPRAGSNSVVCFAATLKHLSVSCQHHYLRNRLTTSCPAPGPLLPSLPCPRTLQVGPVTPCCKASGTPTLGPGHRRAACSSTCEETTCLPPACPPAQELLDVTQHVCASALALQSVTDKAPLASL